MILTILLYTLMVQYHDLHPINLTILKMENADLNFFKKEKEKKTK